MSGVQDYLSILPIVAERGWIVRTDGRYRGAIQDAEGRCPLCSLAHEIDPSVDETYAYRYALARCGLPWDDDSNIIAAAADYGDHPWRPALMAALGMRSAT